MTSSSTSSSSRDLELWLEQLEQAPYRHQRSVHFLSYLYDNPEVVQEYHEIISIALGLIIHSSDTITDEPDIYQYQCTALIAYFTQPAFPQWDGIPDGEADKVAWAIFQYHPMLSK